MYIYTCYIYIYIYYIYMICITYIYVIYIYIYTRIWIFIHIYERTFGIANLVSLLGKHQQPVLPSQGHEPHGPARGAAAQTIHGRVRARRLGIEERPRESASKILCTHTTHTNTQHIHTLTQYARARARAHTHTHTHANTHRGTHTHTHKHTQTYREAARGSHVHDAVRQPHPHEAVNHVAHQRVVSRLEVHVRVPVETPMRRDGDHHLFNPLWVPGPSHMRGGGYMSYERRRIHVIWGETATTISSIHSGM